MEDLTIQIVKHNERIKRLEERGDSFVTAIFGDGNGNKGLIRRVDKVDGDVNFIKRQNWVIITMLVGIMIAMIEKVMR